MGEFMECDTCRKLPGTPPLCTGCLHNRAIIKAYQQAEKDRIMTPDYEPSVAELMGRDAFKAGRSLQTNPYKIGGVEYVAWETGYRNAAHPPRTASELREDDVTPAGIDIGNCVVITGNQYSRWKHSCYFGWVTAIVKRESGWSYRVCLGPDESDNEYKAEYVERYEDGEHLFDGDD